MIRLFVFFASIQSLRAITLLPLGDSITCGCGSDAGPANNFTAVCPRDVGGYRVPLWASLAAAGSNISFVGSLRNGPAWAPPAATAHEGHPGWTTSQIIQILPTWVAYRPDVIVVHLGTNDVGQNHSLPRMLTDMTWLLGNISSALPAARVFLCTIIDMVSKRSLPRVHPNRMHFAFASYTPRCARTPLNRLTRRIRAGFLPSQPTTMRCATWPLVCRASPSST